MKTDRCKFGAIAVGKVALLALFLTPTWGRGALAQEVREARLGGAVAVNPDAKGKGGGLVITWPTPAAITVGTKLSSAQLDATANEAGTFVYTPAAGTVLPAGLQTLTEDFTPTGGPTYTTSVSLLVLPAGETTGNAFGHQPVGSPTEAHLITFRLPPTLTLNTTTPVQVLTQGAPGLDFQNVLGKTTCGVNSLVANGCTVAVSFVPTAAGQRNGAVVLYGSSGEPIATAFVSGVSTGAQVAFDPGVPAEWSEPALKWGQSGEDSSPNYLAVDGAGNVYASAADGSGTTGIYKIGPGGAYTPILTGQPGSMGKLVVDPAGNLYYVYAPKSSTTENVMELVNGQPVPVITGLHTVQGLAVDSSGNVFAPEWISESNGHFGGLIQEFLAASRTVKPLSIGTIADRALSAPDGLAVDGSENLYINDSGNSRIVKVPASGAPSVVLTYPVTQEVFQIALGGNGDLYISGAGVSSEIYKLTPSGALTTVLSGTIFGNHLNIQDITVDGSGKLYLVPTVLGGSPYVLEIDRTTDSLNFGNVPYDSSANSSDAQEFTIENIGNETLDFSVGGSTNKGGLAHNAYTLPNGYVLAALPPVVDGGQVPCPVTYSADAKDPSYTLAPDTECGLAVAFEPETGLAGDGNMIITDNALNVAASQQTVALTAIADVQITFKGCPLSGTAPACTASYTGSPIPVTVATLPAGLAVSIEYQMGTVYPRTPAAPIIPGKYAVIATVTTPGYVGSVTGTLDIETAQAQFAFSVSQNKCPLAGATPDCSATYTGSGIPVTVTTVPAGLPVTITYADVTSPGLKSTASPSTVGSYTVVATVTGSGYAGTLTGSLLISKATPVVNWPTPAQLPNGAPITAAQLDATSAVPGTIAYSYASNYPSIPALAIGAVLPTGAYNLMATLTPNDTTDYTNGTATQTIIVGKPTWVPSPLNIGNVIVGTNGPFTALSFTNNSTSPVNCNNATYTSGGSTIALTSVGMHLASLGVSSGATAAALPPGAQCTFTFIYEPTAVASLSLTMAIPGVTQTEAITAMAIPPPISLAPATVNFGTLTNPIIQGQTNTQTLTLTNNTSGTLTGIVGVILTPNHDFTFVPSTGTPCTPVLVLAAGASCNYAVQFAPTSANGSDPYADNSLQVTVPYLWNDYQGAQTSFSVESALDGVNATPPQAVLTTSPSPALITEVAGQRAGSAEFVLTNTGGAILNNIQFSNTSNYLAAVNPGDNPSAFILNDGGITCGFDTQIVPPATASLPGGDTCRVYYTLSPAITAPGKYTATFSVLTPLSATALTATLTGVVYALPTMTPASSGSTFTNVPLNSQSAPFTVTLTNATAGALTILNTPVGPTGCQVPSPAVTPEVCSPQAAITTAADYKITGNTCGTSLAAAPAGQPPSTCKFTIDFTPTSESDGTYQPYFTVNTSFSAPAPLGTQTLQLQSRLLGSAQPLPIVVLNPGNVTLASGSVPPTLTFPAQTVGTVSNVQTATLSNTVVYSVVTLQAPQLSGPGKDDFQVTVSCDEPGFTAAGAGTLPGGNGAMCTYTILFAPVAGGPSAATATMTIPTSESGFNAVFNFTGAALAPYTGRVVWIPDFEASLLHVQELKGTKANDITVQLPNTTANTCNPTNVTASLAYAFVFCSSAAGNTDELLVYDANAIRNATGAIDPTPLETWVNQVGTWVGTQPANGALDAEGNLWYTALSGTTGTTSPSVLEIPASVIADGALQPSFGEATAQISLSGYSFGHNFIQPNGLTFSPDGSLWISGSEYGEVDYGGPGPVKGSIYSVLINVPASQLTSYDPAAYSCVSSSPSLIQSTDPNVTCIAAPAGFNDPSGLAIFNKMLWVSVTGAAQFGVTTSEPGREIIGFPLTLSTNPNMPDTLGAPVPFGSASAPTASPFVCPGGLFAQATGAVHLWINDSGYGDSTKPPTCGGAGDIAPETGGVFDYTATQLDNKTALLPAYLDVTARPGPGGIFVENDQ